MSSKKYNELKQVLFLCMLFYLATKSTIICPELSESNKTTHISFNFVNFLSTEPLNIKFIFILSQDKAFVIFSRVFLIRTKSLWHRRKTYLIRSLWPIAEMFMASTWKCTFFSTNGSPFTHFIVVLSTLVPFLTASKVFYLPGVNWWRNYNYSWISTV